MKSVDSDGGELVLDGLALPLRPISEVPGILRFRNLARVLRLESQWGVGVGKIRVGVNLNIEVNEGGLAGVLGSRSPDRYNGG